MLVGFCFFLELSLLFIVSFAFSGNMLSTITPRLRIRSSSTPSIINSTTREATTVREATAISSTFGFITNDTFTTAGERKGKKIGKTLFASRKFLKGLR